MSIPRSPSRPPSGLPPADQQPPDPSTRWRKEKRLGAIVATLVVGLFSLTGLVGGWLTPVTLAPVLAPFGILLGSVLTIFERTRQFAVGFLIANAILIFVSAGVCVAAWSLRSGAA